MRSAGAGTSHLPVDRAVSDRASPLFSALFLCFAALVLVRVGLNPLLLDLLINYRSDSGSIVEKIHPTIYGFLGIGLVALACFRIPLDPWEVRVVRAMLAFLAGIVFVLAATALLGRGGSAGYLVDTYATACSAALMFLFPVPWRRKIGHILIGMLALSAVIALVEFVLKTRIQPFSETEASFRPLGLSAHPLDLGLWTATSISFCAGAYWSVRIRIAACALLLVGLGASGARTAFIVGLASALFLAVGAVGQGLSSRRRLEWRIIVMVLALAAVPVLIGGLYGIGALDRFQGGLADANARTRVDIYRIFDYMTWSQILFGMEPALLVKITKTYLKIEFVESSIVFFVTLFGLIGTSIFFGLFAWLLRVMLIGAKEPVLLAIAVFFVIALSSNILSSKGPSIFMLFVLIIAFRPEPSPHRRGARA